MSFFSRKKKKTPTISKPFHPDAAAWNRDPYPAYAGYYGPTSAPPRDYSGWRPPMPYGFSPGSPPWKSSNSSSDRRGRDERFEGSSSSGSQSYDMSRYGLDRSPRPRRAHPPERHPQNPRTRDLHRRQRTPEPEDEDDDPEEIYEEEMYDEDYSEEEDLPPPPSRSRRPQPPPAEARRLETKGRRPRRAPESDYTYTPDPYKNQQHGDRYLRPAYSAANLTLAESDLYADRTAVSTNVQTVTRSRSHGRYERPDTPTSQHSQRSRKSAKKQPAPPAPDGSDQWCTRTVEPLARIRLNTVIKSLQESDESLFYSLTSFTLDLSEPDPTGTSKATFMSMSCEVLAHLSKLESLRIIGPKDARITLPASFGEAISKSRAGLLSFALSRVSSIDNVADLAKLVGPTCTTLKLNDCKMPVWRPFLRHCVWLENLEALVPPEGLNWLSRSQWSQLVSLRLGYGCPEVLEDLLESATAVEGEEPYQTALETLVISHFAPLPLPLVIRLSRTLGTPLVRKLELSRISASCFEPRLLQNLAAYFDSVEDLRIHAADDGEEELSLQEGRKVRTKPVDWTRGRWGIDDWGMALAGFSILRAVEINHSRYPYLLTPEHLKASSNNNNSKDNKKGGNVTNEPDGIPVTPEGVSLTDTWTIDARGLANKCRTLKRVGYSFGVTGRYLDCSVKFSKTQRAALPLITAHWSKPTSSG